MENLRIYGRDGDNNTEGRTSIRDILAEPPAPPTPSILSQFPVGAGRFPQPLRFDTGDREIFDAGLVRIAAGQIPGAGDGVDAARNGPRGGRLRNLARRAGQSIKRVFRGAVSRVTRGNNQARGGNATVQRQGRDPRRQSSMTALRSAMAGMAMAMGGPMGARIFRTGDR